MKTHTPSWMRATLVIAGVYNLLFGIVVVLQPNLFFERIGIQTPIYPAIWQCVGMIVGVYGVGYLIAANNPARHWPIVLVGLLGKLFGPIGFVYAAVITDQLPRSFGWVLIPNDLIWWIPFAMILYHAARTNQLHPDARYAPALTPQGAIQRFSDQSGKTIAQRSFERPVILVFLRHMGCTFCLQTLDDLRDQLATIREHGCDPVIVHMTPDSVARPVLVRFGLEGLARVSDPEQTLYQAFELSRGSFLQLFGPRAWIGGLRAMLRGHFVGRLKGDGFQMPGVFVIRNGRVDSAVRHRSVAERVPFAKLAREASGLDACEVPIHER